MRGEKDRKLVFRICADSRAESRVHTGDFRQSERGYPAPVSGMALTLEKRLAEAGATIA